MPKVTYTKNEQIKDAIRFSILLLRKRDYYFPVKMNKTLHTLFKRACKQEGVRMNQKFTEFALAYVYEKGVLTREDVAMVTYDDAVQKAMKEKIGGGHDWKEAQADLEKLGDIEIGVSIPNENGFEEQVPNLPKHPDTRYTKHGRELFPENTVKARTDWFTGRIMNLNRKLKNEENK